MINFYDFMSLLIEELQQCGSRNAHSQISIWLDLEGPPINPKFRSVLLMFTSINNWGSVFLSHVVPLHSPGLWLFVTLTT
jgi:hypothetical protein